MDSLQSVSLLQAFGFDCASHFFLVFSHSVNFEIGPMSAAVAPFKTA